MKPDFVWLATNEYEKNNSAKNDPQKLVGIEFEIKQDASDYSRRENKKNMKAKNNKPNYVVLQKFKT